MSEAIHIRREVNLNTVAIIVGFVATLISVGASWSNLQAEQKNFATFVAEQKATNAGFSERLSAHDKTLEELPQVKYQVAQLEKSDERNDDRIARIGENYSNQFSEMRNQLGSISVQMALIKQSLDRIEAWDGEPGGRTGPR